MGRQPKQGLDYFPFDVGLLSDPKLRRPRQKYGYLAQVIYIALLCILYRDKGYYIPYGGEQREDVIWQVGDMLCVAARGMQTKWVLFREIVGRTRR